MFFSTIFALMVFILRTSFWSLFDLRLFFHQGDTSGDYRKILLELCGGEWTSGHALTILPTYLYL